MKGSTMNPFSFFSPGKIVFGAHSFLDSTKQVARFGTHLLIVAGGGTLRSLGVLEPAIAALEECLPQVTVYEGIRGEPTPETIDEGVALVQEAGCDCVMAVGGGSVLDTGKAIAAVSTNDGPVTDYLEGVGAGLSFSFPPLPFIAVPTTAGTGSEATKNAVIVRPGKFKKSLRSPMMVPQLAIVDPVLTMTLPPALTAVSGLDAFCQLLEGYVTPKRNYITEALCSQGLKLCAHSLSNAYRDGTDLEARSNMAAASLMSGMALANGGLGAVHGFAAGLGAVCGIRHGLACAVLLPAITAANAEADPERYAPLGRIFTGRICPSAVTAARAAVVFINDLCRSLRIPEKLTDIGVTEDQLEEVVDSSQGNSMRGNPVEMTKARQLELLKSIV